MASVFVAVALLATLAAAGQARAVTDAAPSVLVSDGQRWVSVTWSSGALAPLAFPKPYLPLQAALAPNGVVVFTAYDEAAQAQLLYAWTRPSGEVRSIGDARGYHADPSVSTDGEWVYFAHHPETGGPPGRHGPKAYAQVYRVHLDGSKLEALTSEPGCHIAPVSPGKDAVLFVHTDCGRQRVLSTLRAGDASSVALDLTGALLQLSLSPQGRYVAAMVESVETSSVFEVNLTQKALHPKRLMTVTKQQHPGQVWHGAHRGELLFLVGSRLLWLRDGRTCQLLDFQVAQDAAARDCAPLTGPTAALVDVAR